jgi:anti-sigma-K factor RskA
MSATHDPFRHDDAAYVLGALDDGERAAFERHLAGCPDCTARVREIEVLPGVLSGIPVEQAGAANTPAVPDTLWPALVRRASAERRRRRAVVGGLAAAAVAASAVAATALWPAGSAPTAPAARAMAPLGAGPLRASAALVSKPWGTEIDLACHYDTAAAPGYAYTLVVVDRGGTSQQLGSWTLAPGGTTRFAGGTALPADQIASIQVQAAGQPVLQLTR